MPDQATVRRALERAEFVVVQEAFATTATCDYADLLLPATTWGEKDGTVTNSERRISRVRPAVPAPGQARHDWAIAVDFARRLEPLLPPPPGEGWGGGGPRPGQPPSRPSPGGGRSKTLFAYESPESIWLDHRESTRGRDLDITGLGYALLEQSPRQWPFAEGAADGKPRLYEDGVFPTPDGKARFAVAVYRPLAEPRESRYPFSLTTGRLRDHWHGMSRTGTLARLFGHVAEPAVQMHPQDMLRRQLKEGDLVHVTSKRGSIVVPVQAGTDLGLGQAFIAMHWGEEFLSGVSSTGNRLTGVNALTTSAYCPQSKQPELKHAAVKIMKAELGWSVLAMGWLPEDGALRAREALRRLMAAFPFATCVPFGRERAGVLFRAAAYEPPPDAVLAQVEVALLLDGPQVLRYADRRHGQRRVARLARHGADSRLEGFLLAGDTRAESWIRTLLQEERPAQAYGRLLLSPGAKAPVAVVSRGRQVCTCFNVGEAQILGELAGCEGDDGARLKRLQDQLRCGTNCGSCIPELKRMVRATPALRRAA
jgi:assimilatory nitrate reductase catalytic subunit